MTAPAGQVVACANCGRTFSGRFCPDCGQDLEDIRRPFAEIARDFLGDFFAFDARLWRTLVPLFTRPGSLTVDYIEGRRARYVPPLKLYVFAGFLYFTIVAIGGGGPFGGFVQETDEGITVGIGGSRNRPDEEVRDEVTPQDTPDSEALPGASGTRDTAEAAPDLGRALEERAQRAAEDPEAYGRALQGALSYAHFLLLPVLALLLKAFYGKRYYAEHLVFGMHFHAFALLPAAVIVAAVDFIPGLEPDGTAASAMASLWMLALIVYPFLALRRVYGGSFLGTLGRWAAVGFLYAILASLILAGVAFLTLWMY